MPPGSGGTEPDEELLTELSDVELLDDVLAGPGELDVENELLELELLEVVDELELDELELDEETRMGGARRSRAKRTICPM